MHNAQIRPLLQEELSEALRLVRRVFAAFEAPGYHAEGVASFETFLTSVPAQFAAGNFPMWGAFLQGTLAGVIALRNRSHISLLFVDASYHRRGIARSLIEQAAAFARRQESPALTVNSSPYAVPVYHRLGFRDTSAQQCVDGIVFTPMYRPL